MSLPAVLEGTRDLLWKEGWDQSDCDVQPDPQPTPICGKRYLSIHAVSWQNNEPNMMSGWSESISIACTLTLRAPIFPRDRVSKYAYLNDLKGMAPVIRGINSLLHDSTELLALINSHIPAEPHFIEMMRWSHSDVAPHYVDSTWFWTEPTKDPGSVRAGLVMTTYFSPMIRYQTLDQIRS